ncbi:hypothetical protein GUJ93_ZPchr0006g42869 [Zizania palustris]|uniref:FKBP12-interacting protein of 37 kDa n=1 Tax=Zizania palustris TaxID=103762 RepID=A0A8J5TG32_ZIZPA|nr:hypothetical protein GUJ93_ZPchr0006g42869 [Zizania palustris]
MDDPPSPRLDEEDAFGRDFNSSPSPTAAPARSSGDKRPFGDLEDDDEDVFASKKGKTRVEESAPGAATGMILSLRESLQNCKDNLASCQVELEAAKSEVQKWHSAFQNIPAVPAGTNPDPVSVVSYLNSLKSSEESLKEQLEKAKKREAAFISAVRDLKTQLRPPSMQTRRLLLDPAIHEEFTRLKNLVEEKDKKIKELQDNIAAVNFTPSSKHGKMLMAKCRTLQEENEEIGVMASEGKERGAWPVQEVVDSLKLMVCQVLGQASSVKMSCQLPLLPRNVDVLCRRVEDAVGLGSLRIADENSSRALVIQLADVVELLEECQAAEDVEVANRWLASVPGFIQRLAVKSLGG